MNTGPSNKTSLVNEYAKQIAQSFRELDHPVDSSTVEQLAIFLVRTMGSESRDYHRPEHSLDVSKLPHAIPRFAALFHDLIYLQVDSSWRLVKDQLEPFVPSESLTVDVPSALARTTDPWLHAIAELFGVSSEVNLNAARGVNEFLSAVVMYKKLCTYLSPAEMLRALACVEATIFFDKFMRVDQSPEVRLRQNLDRASRRLGLPAVSERDFAATVVECREIIERDLSSFASADLSDFVSNTWNVMIENNQTLRNSYYLISNYRRAIYGVINFISGLDPKKMYWNED